MEELGIVLNSQLKPTQYGNTYDQVDGSTIPHQRCPLYQPEPNQYNLKNQKFWRMWEMKVMDPTETESVTPIAVYAEKQCLNQILCGLSKSWALWKYGTPTLYSK